MPVCAARQAPVQAACHRRLKEGHTGDVRGGVAVPPGPGSRVWRIVAGAGGHAAEVG